MRKISVAALAAVALTVIACGSGGDDADKASDQPVGGTTQDEQAAPKAEKKAGLGDKVRDGKFEFTVTKMDCSKTRLGDQYVNTEAQGKFCLVTLTIKNIGDEAQLFDASSQKAFDAKGTTYDADSGAAIYANKNAETFLNSINPGNQVKGNIPFDVPKNVKITELELHDSPFSGGVRVTVK